MTNHCYYEMKVVGEEEDLKEFYRILKNDHNEGIHLQGIFKANIHDLEEEASEGALSISGECAWSVHVCMTEGKGSYYQDDKLDKSEKKGSSLERESSRLNLSIEVYSQEEGVGFEEHVLVQDGKLVTYETEEVSIYYPFDYETLEELNEENEKEFTLEQFEEQETIEEGGFSNWDYVI